MAELILRYMDERDATQTMCKSKNLSFGISPQLIVKNNNGMKSWHYINVEREKVIRFRAALSSHGGLNTIDLRNFGDILEEGEGEPDRSPEKLKQLTRCQGNVCISKFKNCGIC